MPEIKRIDHYNITIGGIRVRATADQEERLRKMTPEQRERFVKIMGGDLPDA